MAALISYVPLYRPAGFPSIPLLRHQHINPVRRSDLPAHPQDQSVILQFQKGPLAGLRTVPQRHGQLHNGKLAGVSFGYGKGAACWPRLGGWCLVFRFWLDNVCPEVGECSAICCFLLSSHLKSVQNCLDKYKRSRNIHKNLDAHQSYN